MQTKGHVFWKVCLDGKKIGDFWFHRKADDPVKMFVYDTLIKKDYQSQGIGTAEFALIQKRLKALGVRKIGLHVFAHNIEAVRLHERLGFKYTGHNMHFLID